MKYIVLLLSLLIVFTSPSFAKRIHKACKVISATEVNSILGSNVVAPKPLPKGDSCEYKSANGYIKVVVSYVTFKDEESALATQKKKHDEYLATVKQGNKVLNEYTVLGTVPGADSNAYYMTGDGSVAAGPNTVCLQFVLGKYIITFHTQGMMKTMVVPRLGEIYKAITD